MTDQELITALTLSCRRQLEMYRRLLDTAQGILGRLAVSRGDLSALTPAFRQKQEILDAIAAERRDSTSLVTLWQERKEAARAACNTTDLDTALAEIESVIKRFLDNEEQIKRYLERAVKGRDAADHGN